LSKFHYDTKLWALQNIFAGLFNFDSGPNMAISKAEHYAAAPGAGLAGKLMGAQA
jgi:hypothetical protein